MPGQAIPTAEDFMRHGRTSSPAATRRLGARAADRLRGGEILLLWGPLGAGKTCFVQGLCAGLGVPDDVTSPSFNLLQEYHGRLTVQHLDFYRLEPGADLADVGVEAVLDAVEAGGAVLVVEWPEPLLPLLDARLELLALPGAAEQERTWHLRARPVLPPAWEDLLAPEEPPC
jgi:tRNA threonylcarbamoyladenosine biosynthesis protein TsaE